VENLALWYGKYQPDRKHFSRAPLIITVRSIKRPLDGQYYCSMLLRNISFCSWIRSNKLLECYSREVQEGLDCSAFEDGTDSHFTVRKIPEERRSHLHRGGSLKSRKIWTLWRLRVKCRICLCDFNQIWIFSTDSRKSRQYQIRRKSVKGGAALTHADGHDEAKRRFSLFMRTHLERIATGPENGTKEDHNAHTKILWET
jgi:hypothetical protein